jgi:hypothetical protein
MIEVSKKTSLPGGGCRSFVLASRDETRASKETRMEQRSQELQLVAHTPQPTEDPSPAPHSLSERVDEAEAADDAIEQIRRLGELRDAGLITPDEFDAKKAELLSRL